MAAVAIPTVGVALAVNFAIRALALARFQIPLAALPLTPIIMASIGAVVGPAIGCYLAFRESGPHSMRNFLLPGVGFTLMGIVIELVRFRMDHHNSSALLVGVSQGLIAIGLSTPVLLWLVARTRG